MRGQFSIPALVLAIFACALSGLARAGEGCCDHCGCQSPCQRICRLVCEPKKVDLVCYGCECEEFCIPGPSMRGCKHCEIVCDSCADCAAANGPSQQAKKFVWFDWMPGCATIHTRKKLVKKTVTKTVPSYKWVVEDVCRRCESHCADGEPPAGVPVPPPPFKNARLKYGSSPAVAPVVAQE
jgi:hypothetical protein